jgi:lipopolysaccharide transport system ATP-binding protein
MTESSSNSHLIKLNDVSVSYHYGRNPFKRKKTWALNNCNLTINTGECIGVVGKNGSGKSTLLKVIAGTLSPCKGIVSIKENLKISLLLLQLGFVKHLTGRQNATLSGLFLGLTKNEIESKLDAIIEFSELKDSIDKPLGCYSTGMKARLGLAVALQVNSDVLLIDEILSVGDQGFRAASAIAIRQKLSEGHGSILVSHDLNTLKKLCSRILWIDSGACNMIGPTDYVLNKYQESLIIKT